MNFYSFLRNKIMTLGLILMQDGFFPYIYQWLGNFYIFSSQFLRYIPNIKISKVLIHRTNMLKWIEIIFH